MRKRIEIEAKIDHPVGLVFGYLADPLRWHEFAPAVVLRRQIGDGLPTIGTRWTAIDRIGPLRLHFTDQLVAKEQNWRVVWASSAPWNALTEYSCEADGSGTRVRACYEGDVAGWLRILSWVPSAVIAWFLERDFQRLRARLAKDAALGFVALAPHSAGQHVQERLGDELIGP